MRSDRRFAGERSDVVRIMAACDVFTLPSREEPFGLVFLEAMAHAKPVIGGSQGDFSASGWLADRVGRKIPLMISILWYSICNFIAGFSPSFAFLFFFRALLGIGMGAEWPAGMALAMETWPARSRGLMASVLQGSWAIGFLLSSAFYGLFYNSVGWRGCLWVGILPALVVFWVRKYVKEPEVWQANRQKQRAQNREVHLPLLAIFKRGNIVNTPPEAGNIKLGMQLRLTTFPIGTDSAGVQAVGFGFEPLEESSQNAQ